MADYRHPDDGGNEFGCPRRWAWNKIAGIPRPQHPSAALGEEVHGYEERYLEHGELPDESTRAGAIAAPGIDYLPTPGGDLSIEHSFKFEEGGVNWTGRKDLEYRDSGIYVVHDHKTTSDFKWAKTEDDLRTDPQAIIYAREAFRRLPDEKVRLDWLYLRTTGKPTAKRVSLIVLREENASAMAELVPVGQEMIAHRAAESDPLSLPYNDKACFAYRQRCHYADRCNLSSTSSFASYMSSAKDRMGLAQRLAKAQKSVVQEAPPPEEPKGLTLAEKVRAEGVNPPPYEPPVSEAPEVPVQEKIAKVVETLNKTGCNKEQIASAIRNQFALHDVLTFEGATAVDDAALSAPKKRGRPAGSKNKAKDETPGAGLEVAPTISPVFIGKGEENGMTVDESAAVDQSPGAVARAENAARVLIETAQEQTPPRGFTLLVNCVVVPVSAGEAGVTTVLLANILKEIYAQLRAEHGIKHYKMVDYGKGVGVLNEALRQWLLQNALPDEVFVLVDTRTPEGADCYGTLSEFARLIVRNS